MEAWEDAKPAARKENRHSVKLDTKAEPLNSDHLCNTITALRILVPLSCCRVLGLGRPDTLGEKSY